MKKEEQGELDFTILYYLQKKGEATDKELTEFLGEQGKEVLRKSVVIPRLFKLATEGKIECKTYTKGLLCWLKEKGRGLF